MLVLALALPVAFGLVPGSGAPASGQAQAGRPNLLVLMADDLDTDDLKALPSVRALAQQGTTFSNSFVGYSLCCPSRATYLTGQYSHNNGVLSNAPPDGGFARLDHTNTLPVWLQAAGYHTAHIGKYLNGYESASSHTTVPPGYSDWQGLAIGTYRMYDYSINDDGTLVPYGTAPADYQTDVLADRAVTAIRAGARSPQPFYLKFSPLAPHGSGAVAGHDGMGPDPAPRHHGAFAGEPLDVSPAYDEADVRDKPASIRRLPRISAQARANIDIRNRRRLASMLSVDEAITRMLDELRVAGELDETVIVFTSDNGWQEGEHRVVQGKVRGYEPSIRVPLIVRGPGFARGAVAPAMAINVDLPHTLAAVAGALPGRVQDGLDLREVARGSARALARPLLNESGAPGVSNRNFHQAIRTGTHKYVEHANGERELYDLRSDPDELVNVAGDPAQAATLAQLDARLEVLKTCAGASCVDPQPPALPSPPPPPPASVPDTVTPVARSVRLLDRRIRLGRDKRISIPMRCATGADDGCSGTLRLDERRRRPGRDRLVRMGSRRFSLEPGQYKRVEVKVRASARRRLARKRRMAVRASARYVTVAGELERAERTYRLRAR
ncbi:MAG TPA: sulfatase [Solirubrobacteraceae bacterium]|nr:sulfatase [Solirubrobacteraceae bacterium]